MLHISLVIVVLRDLRRLCLRHVMQSLCSSLNSQSVPVLIASVTSYRMVSYVLGSVIISTSSGPLST